MDVEFRHLRALVAVAEELSFTRAASRLHLTQQALSSQIRQLELRVGAKLVERDTRSVALTPAGAELVDRARPLLAGAELAVSAALTAGGARRTLTVGIIAPLTLRLVTPAMGLFASRHPEVDVSVHFGSFLDPFGGLRDRLADVAVVYGQFDSAGLDLHYLFSEQLGIAVAADHPLAAASEISAEEFLDEPVVDVPVDDPIWRAFWTAASHRGGKPMKVGVEVRTADALIEAIGAGLGVALTTESAVDALGSSANVVFRRVRGFAPLEYSVAHAEGDDRPAVKSFVEAVLDSQRSSMAI